MRQRVARMEQRPFVARNRAFVASALFLVVAALALFSAPSRTCAALVAWYKVDETTGTLAADSSGVGNIGTYTGPVTLGAAGTHRFSVYFAADGQYVTAPASATLNAIGVSNADFSVAFWIKPNGTTGGWRPLLRKGGPDTERGPGIWLNPASNRIHFRISTTAGWNEGTDSVADLPNGKWSHVACVKAGNQWRCYVNGVLDTSFTLIGTTVGNSGPLYFGDDPTYAGCKAWMDDVRVYNSALSDAEVKGLYGVVGYWKLNETSGTVAADSTNAGNTGTYTNGPLINQSGIKDTAANFDGTDDYVAVPDSASLKATDAVTMAAWVRPTSSTNVDRIIINKEGEYELAITDTNEVKWAWANTSPGWNWHQTGTFIPNDAWSHISVTYDGAQAKTYVNGVLVETFAATGDIGDAHLPLNELRIGGRSNNPAGKCFAGLIDEVYIFTRALDAAEVAGVHGLVGHWKFAEGSGTAAADSTLVANNGTLSGGAAWTSDCIGNAALQTNGIGGVAQTANAVTPPAEGTVAFWMKPAGSPVGTARLLGLGGDWEVRQLADGKLNFDICGEAGTSAVSTVPLNVAGQWYHVVETFNSADDTFAIYIDGKLDKTGTNSNAMVQQAAAVLSFGTRTGSTEYWQGGLRDFRVYNRRLNLPEIAQLYGLVGHWKFDETSGAAATDSSGAAANGTVSGTPTWFFGRIQNGLRFDGNTSVGIPGLFGKPKNVTISAWAWLTAADTQGAEVISLGDSFAIRLDNSGTTQAFFYNGTTWTTVSFAQIYAGTGWHHFAAVFDDDHDYCRMYVDGVEKANLATSASIVYTLNQNTTIGRHGNGSTTFDFMGLIDDGRVYNRALCPADVMRLYGSAGPAGVRILKWVEAQ